MSTRTFIVTGLILFLTCVSAYSQDHLKRILSIHLDKASIDEVLADITSQTQVRFSYNPDIMPNELITIHLDSTSVQNVLENIFSSGYQFKVRGSYIIIQPFYGVTSKNAVKVTGKIIDASTGNKLKNTTVYNVNTLDPTLSESDGSYELTSTTGPDDIAVLAISKLNYQDTIIRVSKTQKTPINLFLRPLEEASDQSFSETDSSRLVEILVDKKAQEHMKNVEMEETRWGQVSLFPVLGTNGRLGGQITNHLSLNLISGYSHSVDGIELGAGLNINRQNVRGLQMAGFGNVTGGKTDAAQLAGFWNHNTDSVNGIQMAGFGNFATEFVSGAQIAGFSNKAKSMDGLQLAGFINHVSEQTSGVQISGFINHTGSLRGLQIGIINRADTIRKGLMLGLINLNRNGMIDYEFEYNDITPANFTFRSGANIFYTILTTGVDIWQEKLWSYGAGFGSHWDIIRLGNAQKIYLETELTTNNIHEMTEPLYRDFSLDNRFHLNLGVSLTRNLSINAGGILHYYLFYSPDDATNPFSNRLGDEPLYSDTVGNTYMKLWTGKRFGLRWKI